MKHSYLKATALSVLATASVTAFAAWPTPQFNNVNPLMANPEAMHTYNPFNQRGKVAEGIETSNSLENMTGYGFLTTSDGYEWMYTTEYETEKIVHSEYYTETVVKAFKFTIYDNAFKKIGEIRDKVMAVDPSLGETGIAPGHPLLDPNVTFRFFNDDDKPEVMVYYGINTDDAHEHKMNFYEKIYSIGGEKDEDGNDICIATIKGRNVDAINARTGGEENMFFSFSNIIYPDASEFDRTKREGKVEYAKNIKNEIKIYSKATDETGPKLVMTKEILNVCVGGDTTDGIYLITKELNGKAYIYFSYYKMPYFIDPLGGAEDETATPDNSFMIEAYSLGDGQGTLISTTEIPMTYQDSSEQLHYTFYNLGAVTWKNDIDITTNGTPEAPAYIVTRNETTAANLETVNSYIELYDNTGKYIRELASDAETFYVLNSVGRNGPHIMMVQNLGNVYNYDFIDLYSGKLVTSVPQIFEGQGLLAPAERVLGNDGEYKYVFAASIDDIDEDGTFFKKVVWVNEDGTLHRIDRLNLGKEVQFSQLNMDYNSLSPHVYDTDDAMEYAVLVKRTAGATVNNEFLVIDDSGEWYAQFSKADGKGDPFMFSIYPGEVNRLHMVYVGDDGYNIDIYDLPFFETLGVGSVIDDEALDTTVTYDGTSVIAPNAEIAVYSANGVKVAEGRDSVAVDSFGAGIYVAVVRDARGNKAAVKIAK